MSAPVYHNRFPKVVAKGLCRGCHGPVPKKRFTWCSKACNDRYNPSRVAFFVRQRDGGICQMCGFSIKELREKWKASAPPDFYTLYPMPHANPIFAGRNFLESEEFRSIREARAQHKRNEPKEEYDHIIPFSEGGLTVLENMRTLCSQCHRHRTRQWHIERSMRIRSLPPTQKAA